MKHKYLEPDGRSGYKKPSAYDAHWAHPIYKEWELYRGERESCDNWDGSWMSRHFEEN